MARTNVSFDATIDEVENAKQTAVALMNDNANVDAIDLFYNDNLEYIENGVRNLNNFTNKSWLLSSILIYTIIYSKSLYQQSGLSWEEYSKQSRERLGLDQREVSEQLSSARFYIRNQDELTRQGFNPVGNTRKLSRAELATELCGDVHVTIQHLIKDSSRDFIKWYQSFKPQKELPKATEYKRNDIEIQGSKIFIQGKEAVSISEDIPEQDKVRIEKYITQIFEAIKLGYEPAIIQVYDEKEGKALINLRDKYRQGK